MSQINTKEIDHPELVSITGVQGPDDIHSGIVMAYPASSTGQLKIKHVDLVQSGILIPNEWEPGGVSIMLSSLESGKGQMVLMTPDEARAMATALNQSADEYEEKGYAR